jgi:hypothetical protein
MSPMAMGIEVVPTDSWLSASGTPGKKYPIVTPIIIARKIQRVRNSFRNDSRPLGFSTM